jgi:hypothetical protein
LAEPPLLATATAGEVIPNGAWGYGAFDCPIIGDVFDLVSF